jgi:hypothetical protein
VDGDCFLVGDVTTSNMKRRMHLGTFSPRLIGNFFQCFLINNLPLLVVMNNGESGGEYVGCYGKQ